MYTYSVLPTRYLLKYVNPAYVCICAPAYYVPGRYLDWHLVGTYVGLFNVIEWQDQSSVKLGSVACLPWLFKFGRNSSISRQASR